MDDEINDSVYVGKPKTKSSDSGSTPALPESDMDHEELQTIVNNLVKLPEETQAISKQVKITRITHHEIKSMRATQSNMPAAVVEKKIKGGALIQAFDAFLGIFRSKEKRSRCSIDGHECRHCGTNFKTEEQKAR